MSENSIAAAHTPGPWKLAHDRPMFGWWYIRQDPPNWNGQGYQAICSLPSERKGSHYGDMFAANARLIAAAPDLLAALVGVLPEAEANFCGGDDAYALLDTARKAIAKATGAEKIVAGVAR